MLKLQVTELNKRFGGLHVLKGVSFEVNGPELIGLIGPNGAGKTTTFNLVVGAQRPSAGDVFLGQRAITHLPMFRRARLGIVYLPQEASIFRKLSVADNVNAILETLEASPQRRRARTAELLEELGIAGRARQRAELLSGGERRRVEIARALALNPAFLLLDEPFTGIDPLAVRDIQKLMEQLRARGIGIVITEHKVQETLSVCDRAYILRHGRMIRHGTPEEIAADPRIREVYLGEDFRLG